MSSNFARSANQSSGADAHLKVGGIWNMNIIDYLWHYSAILYKYCQKYGSYTLIRSIDKTSGGVLVQHATHYLEKVKCLADI